MTIDELINSMTDDDVIAYWQIRDYLEGRQFVEGIVRVEAILNHDDDPESQNEANLDPYWEDDPGFRKVYPFLFPADQVWGNG